MTDSTNGKGSKRRPSFVTVKEYHQNHDRIFGHKTAEQRGMEMMSIPIGKLPPIARAFANKLCKEMGMCMEVLLTAWTVYAQCVEGLTCTDDLYKARESDIMWFKEQKRKSARSTDDGINTKRTTSA